MPSVLPSVGGIWSRRHRSSFPTSRYIHRLQDGTRSVYQNVGKRASARDSRVLELGNIEHDRAYLSRGLTGNVGIQHVRESPRVAATDRSERSRDQTGP